MDGFKNIEIKNFRGIDHLKIDDVSRVNVFLGQNSSGKSTVLEAISLLTGMSNPDSPLNMNRLRTRNLFSPFKDLYYLFYNMDIKTPSNLSAEQFDGDLRDLRLQLTYVFDEQAARQESAQNGAQPVSETKTFFNTLCLDFDIVSASGKRSYQSSMTANQEGIISNRKPAADYLEKNASVYLTADLWGINLASQLSELFKRKQKSVVLQRLFHFDRRIVDIDILQDDIYIEFENLPEKLPLRMTGDGLRRYLNIVAASANPTTNIILIDEIDNGLHYSAYKKLWEAIFALATTTNKQVFVTTHSKETLSRLNQMLEESPAYQQELRLYTLEKTKLKGFQAYKYTYEGLSGACENDIEIRSIVM
ncbi:MAG: AAA family ATPase [Bacteroidaceae bacterium]|nr:AAA family ATPase [Bacteroidaceae bacterium]